MNSPIPFPTPSNPQAEAFAGMARDLALFEQQTALADDLLAEHRRNEMRMGTEHADEPLTAA